MSLAGYARRAKTRSGTLIARPGQDVPFLGGGIIPQEITQKCYTLTKKLGR